MVQRSAGSDAQDLVFGFIQALNDEGKTSAVLKRFSRSESLNKKVIDYRVAYPDFRILPVDAFSERGLVVVRFILDLEGRTRVTGSEADVAPELLEAIAVCRVDGGAIAELWFEMDLFAQVLERIGDPTDQEHIGPLNAGVTLQGSKSPVTAADRARPADTSASRSLVLRYLAALNNQPKTPELIERFATDEALVEHVMAFEAGFPGYALVADEIIAAGERVAVRFHTRQLHTREFMGVPPTGLEHSISGIVIYRVVGGKIVEHWLQADTWTLMQRLQESQRDPTQGSAETPSTKRQLIDRRVRGSEYAGTERRRPLSGIVDH